MRYSICFFVLLLTACLEPQEKLMDQEDRTRDTLSTAVEDLDEETAFDWRSAEPDYPHEASMEIDQNRLVASTARFRVLEDCDKNAEEYSQPKRIALDAKLMQEGEEWVLDFKYTDACCIKHRALAQSIGDSLLLKVRWAPSDGICECYCVSKFQIRLKSIEGIQHWFLNGKEIAL
jgi:hypothetical protein